MISRAVGERFREGRKRKVNWGGEPEGREMDEKRGRGRPRGGR